jgi:competence protein ComEA
MNSFDFSKLLFRFRYQLLILLVGLILIGFGALFIKNGLNTASTKVEVLQAATEGQAGSEVTAEIAGEVVNPGVYKLPAGSRVEDLLVASGGFSTGADRV